LRKAEAVKNTVLSKISSFIPATALKNHNNVDLYLDMESASLLTDYALK